MHNSRIHGIWRLLRYSFGAVIFLAGLDKVLGTNFIVNWAGYVSQEAVAVIGRANVPEFLLFVGMIEVIVAVLMLTYWPRLAGYLAAVWLVIISLNLFMLGAVDIALCDLLLAVGVYAGAELAAVLGYPIWSRGRLVRVGPSYTQIA